LVRLTAWVAELNVDSLLGLAAVITALGGILTTIVSSRKSRQEAKRKADQECWQRLKEVRAEAEEAAMALHQLRMEQSRDER